MPSVHPGSKVLVTGASGFIATWIIKTLLEHGYNVRGTVRSTSKGEYLKSLFTGFAGEFEYFVVENISENGAFDDAVKGVDAVEHTASPVPNGPMDIDEILGPALKGTVGILESVLKYGHDVKRVVLTSSTAAIIRYTNIPPAFTDQDWNEYSVKIVEEKGKDAPLMDSYRASKTLAERSAWDFIKNNKEKIKWDFVTINPPMVYGPILHHVPSLSGLNMTSLDFYRVIKGLTPPDTPAIGNWVDVRDVALSHTRVLSVSNAGGNRFIVSAGHYDMQDFLDAIHSPPNEPVLDSVVKGNPGAGKHKKYQINLDTSKARDILGIEFRTIEDSAKDIARSLVETAEKGGW